MIADNFQTENNTPSDLSGRIGRIRVGVSLEDTESMSLIFAGFMPLDVRHTIWQRQLECVGLHPAFDVCEPGSEVPDYDVVLRAADDGTRSVTFQRHG